MHSYKVEYWYLHFIGNDDTGYDYGIVDVEAEDEKTAIKVLSQGAALRFLLTRVFDYLNKVDDAVVKIKDPEEYLKRLEFHKNAKSFEDYLI